MWLLQVHNGTYEMGVSHDKLRTFLISKQHNSLTGDSFPWLAVQGTKPSRPKSSLCVKKI